MTAPSDNWHRLTNVDRHTRTALCSICGPTRIRIRNNASRGGECLTARRATRKKPADRTPESRLRSRLRSQYKLSDSAAAVVEEAVALGTTTCPICLRSGQVMHIDHDHACCAGGRSCGECARGYICRDCNRGLGQFRDDTEALSRAIDYLIRPPFQIAG